MTRGGGLPTTAVFDIGKTNKKLFLFDEDLKIVFKESIRIPETVDEDGDSCEDLPGLIKWVNETFLKILKSNEFRIVRLNVSTYGASFVHLDKKGKLMTPLYNYLKPFPEHLNEKFYNTYGASQEIALETSSPALGNLNAGMQLYRLKYARPDVFKNISTSVHLPQYIASLFTGQYYSDITSIGCHTRLWNFNTNQYHRWVGQENLLPLLPPIVPSTTQLNVLAEGHSITCGVGLHDSSASLIPYLKCFTQPFILLSTGTWSISLNPFNHTPLTYRELQRDCLHYLSYHGDKVKASRLFIGFEFDQEIKRMSEFFHVDPEHFQAIKFIGYWASSSSYVDGLAQYSTADQAYHAYINDLVRRQIHAISLINPGNEVKCIFVDGGFSQNDVFMHLLARYHPDTEVYAASVAQATALGAALAITPDQKNLHNHFTLIKYEERRK